MSAAVLHALDWPFQKVNDHFFFIIIGGTPLEEALSYINAIKTINSFKCSGPHVDG